MSVEELRGKLLDEIGDFESFEDEEALFEEMFQVFRGMEATLEEALDLEDVDSTGFISIEGLYAAFTVLENIPKHIQDFVAVLLYSDSGDTEKLEYKKIIDMLGEKTPVIQATEPDKPEEDYGEDDFEKEPQIEEEEGDQQLPPEEQKQTDGEGEDDEEIDDEKMIDIAEDCLIKLAEALLTHQVSIRQLFQDAIENKDNTEVVSPLNFIEGLNALQLEYSELEIACLMNILAKPQLENFIVIEELVGIMENFGIMEEEGDMDEAEPKQPEDPDKSSKQADSERKEPEENKGKKKVLDFSLIGEPEIFFLYELN